MSDHQENKSQASSEAKKPPVEDLAPTEEQSADLKGGPIHGTAAAAAPDTAPPAAAAPARALTDRPQPSPGVRLRAKVNVT